MEAITEVENFFREKIKFRKTKIVESEILSCKLLVPDVNFGFVTHKFEIKKIDQTIEHYEFNGYRQIYEAVDRNSNYKYYILFNYFVEDAKISIGNVEINSGLKICHNVDMLLKRADATSYKIFTLYKCLATFNCSKVKFLNTLLELEDEKVEFLDKDYLNYSRKLEELKKKNLKIFRTDKILLKILDLFNEYLKDSLTTQTLRFEYLSYNFILKFKWNIIRDKIPFYVSGMRGSVDSNVVEKSVEIYAYEDESDIIKTTLTKVILPSCSFHEMLLGKISKVSI